MLPYCCKKGRKTRRTAASMIIPFRVCLFKSLGTSTHTQKLKEIFFYILPIKGNIFEMDPPQPVYQPYIYHFQGKLQRNRGIFPKINKHLCCCLHWRHLSKNADFSLAKRQGKEIDIAKQTNNFGAQNIYV